MSSRELVPVSSSLLTQEVSLWAEEEKLVAVQSMAARAWERRYLKLGDNNGVEVLLVVATLPRSH